jgi:hypothetical protein
VSSTPRLAGELPPASSRCHGQRHRHGKHEACLGRALQLLAPATLHHLPSQGRYRDGFAAYAVASWIRDWLDDGPTTRQAGTVESYRRLAGHAIGEPGTVKLKDLTARQVHKALAELPASLPARSLRPPVLTPG